jgi:hypothetical protein
MENRNATGEAMRSDSLTLAALILLAACGERGPKLATVAIEKLPSGVEKVTSPGPTAWSDTSGWKLVEVYRIGGAESEAGAELIEPQDLTLDPSGGVYISDQKPAVIKQFDATGRFVRTIGRDGSGPGEFRVAFLAAAPGHLVVHDPRSSRTSVFDSAGIFLRSWNSSCCFWSSIMVDRDGTIRIPTDDDTKRGQPGMAAYIRYRLDGTLIDTMRLEYERVEEKFWSLSGGSGSNKMQMMTTIPLARSVELGLDPAGGVVLGRNDRYELVVSGTGQDTVQVFGRAATGNPIDGARRQLIRDSLVENFAKQFDKSAVEQAFRVSDLPSTAPLFRSVAVDRLGNRWLEVDDDGVAANRRFDVFDSTGAYLGQVPIPHDFGNAWGTAWGTDRVATSTEDADGMPVVVVYGIAKGSPKTR